MNQSTESSTDLLSFVNKNKIQNDKLMYEMCPVERERQPGKPNPFVEKFSRGTCKTSRDRQFLCLLVLEMDGLLIVRSMNDE